MEAKIDLTAPIIIIGAGRSGSTLLSAMLSLHPDISFHGETSFYIPQIWSNIMEHYNFFIGWPERIKDIKLSGKVLPKETSIEIRRNEEKRIANIIINSLIDIVGIDRSKKHWGYKEIWNGGHAHYFDWKIYDQIFPQATWVHIIRNPFHHVDSQARNSGQELTDDFILNQLSDWTSIINYSRLRQQTGRYFEFRYEDLLEDPRGILTPLFNHLEIEWSDLCAKALATKWVPARHPRSQRFPQINPTIPGLNELIEEFNYTEDIKNLGINIIDQRNVFFNKQVIVDLNKFQYINDYYAVPLGGDSRLAFLHLYENDQKIGPVVSNINIVKTIGRGSYCFAKIEGNIYLMMSTSDNTDPVKNNRNYSLRN
jgi:hypothetical protein